MYNLKKHLISPLFLLIGFLLISPLAKAATTNTLTSISSNPAAVNIITGTGQAQRYLEKSLGITNNHGLYIGGIWVADANNVFSGGIAKPQRWTYNNVLLLDVKLDTEKFNGWEGGLFNLEFLQFNGQNTNGQVGTVQGYNSLPGPPPLNRFEMYQFWYQQKLLSNTLLVRLGKSVPTFEFNNVVKPVPLNEDKLYIPAVSGLIYTPIFVNSSMLAVIPGFYNSTYGITLSYTPVKSWYFSYGMYDGNLARGKQTGRNNRPTFNGSYFHIAETGAAWLLGKNDLPGSLGVGAWHQTGPLKLSQTQHENGASGLYLFGSQRLWYKNPHSNTSGLSAYYQFGINNSHTLPVTHYAGAGLTAFGLIPHRLNDSMGLGAALAFMNQQSYSRPTELILQAYYQAKLFNTFYLEPVISYIPTPAAEPHLNAAWAGTLRAILLF